jgi:hypothetical protein
MQNIYFYNAIKSSVFNYWIKDSIKKELAMLSPWGCKPFYSPRQAKLVRKYWEGISPFTSPSKTLSNNHSKTNMMGLVGLYALILPKKSSKLNL